MRLGDGEAQQIKRLLLGGGRGREGDGEKLKAARCTEAGRDARQLLVDLEAVERPRPLVKQIAGHIPRAILAFGVLQISALEAEPHRDDWGIVELHEPGLDAARAHDLLDLGQS